MIPKTIHYCWFGGKPLPKKDKKCIDSWKKFCPDYEIIEWNESNYDVTKNQYMQDAYIEKKWGFVSDYTRIDIVYHHGGIYMDTDVELLKPLDNYLIYPMYCGFEDETKVNFGLGFAAESGHLLLKQILEEYNHLSFYKEQKKLNLTPSPIYQTECLLKNGLVPNNTCQKFVDAMVFSTEYLCPLDYETQKMRITEKTISIHHFHSSWFSPYDRFRRRIKRMIGKKSVMRIQKLKKKLR